MSIKALIMTDPQKDFMPGGALPVPGGHEIIPVLNRLQQLFEVVVATQDWHPPEHGSFAMNHPGKKPGDVIALDGLPQVLWPVHCVQNTPGAEFVPGLSTARLERVFQKAVEPQIDSYSGFFDNGHRRATGLGDYLVERKVDEVYVAGLATDYCVKFTAIDSVALGFQTRVIEDACRGLDPEGVKATIEEMKHAGVAIIQSR
jgi:nicotinamidase/pyrazinamidase